MHRSVALEYPFGRPQICVTQVQVMQLMSNHPGHILMKLLVLTDPKTIDLSSAYTLVHKPLELEILRSVFIDRKRGTRE